jgi:hypothetical protein
MVCFARPGGTEPVLGIPFCLDCFDYDGQVVWNLAAGELWRRTTIAMRTDRDVPAFDEIQPNRRHHG